MGVARLRANVYLFYEKFNPSWIFGDPRAALVGQSVGTGMALAAGAGFRPALLMSVGRAALYGQTFQVGSEVAGSVKRVGVEGTFPGAMELLYGDTRAEAMKQWHKEQLAEALAGVQTLVKETVKETVGPFLNVTSRAVVAATKPETVGKLTTAVADVGDQLALVLRVMQQLPQFAAERFGNASVVVDDFRTGAGEVMGNASEYWFPKPPAPGPSLPIVTPYNGTNPPIHTNPPETPNTDPPASEPPDAPPPNRPPPIKAFFDRLRSVGSGISDGITAVTQTGNTIGSGISDGITAVTQTGNAIGNAAASAAGAVTGATKAATGAFGDTSRAISQSGQDLQMMLLALVGAYAVYRLA